jgi:beta-glucanase (GH16 family)
LDTTKWTAVTTASGGYSSGTTACFVNSPNNVSVGDGYLSLTAEKEATPFVCTDPFGNFTTQYTSGSVTTSGLFSQTFGRVEVMAKVPSTAVPGLQSSLWLYPQTGTMGELDMAEAYSDDPGMAVPYFHYSPNSLDMTSGTNDNTQTNNGCAINAGQFNDFVIEWSATTITVTYNGNTCLIDNYSVLLGAQGTPFNQPEFINLTQALGIAPNTFDPATTPLPSTTEVKYVRAWQVQP